MKNKSFVLIDNNDRTFIIKANCPEVAYIKAGRLGDLGWFIEDELDSDKYCYTVMKIEYAKEHNELNKVLFNYFKSKISDKHYDAYLHLDRIEQMINLNNHEDVVNYVLKCYC